MVFTFQPPFLAGLSGYVAEISSLMMADQLGIPHKPDRHAAYVASWIKALESDPREIFRAAADAEKISRMLQGFEHQQAQAIGQPGQGPLGERIEPTLHDSYADRSHYVAHGSGPLEDALRARGLDTVGAIVGAESTDFPTMFNTAIERLSPVYGIAPDYSEPTNAYYERKGLATDFATRGEQLLQGKALSAGDRFWRENEERAAAAEPPAVTETTETITTPILTDPNEVAMKTNPEPVYLAVPYAEKNEAKELGAKWDKEAKSWYAPAGVDLAPLERWLPNYQSTNAHPELDPRVEFKSALKEAGLIVDGLPQMDGQMVRVKVEGDKGKERSGTYVGHSDGHPAGYINNFRTGYEGPWKASAAHAKALTGQERAKLAAEAAARRAQRDRERDQSHEAVAHAVEAHFGAAPLATDDHAYLKRKDVPAYGVRVDQAGGLAVPPGAPPEDQQAFSRPGSLLVPLQDMDGRLWSAQAIDGSGFKSFPKGGRYSGLHHMIGDVGGTGAIIIAEGYSTSAELHRETSLPVAVAFSSNNLEAVALAFRERHPDRPLIIAGDNDHRKPLELDAQGRPKPNVGREKAEAAAEAVAGYPMLPAFDPDDRGTDWNDLRREKGQGVFSAQVRAGLASAQRHQLARESGAVTRGPATLEQQPDRQQRQERAPIRVDEGQTPPRRARTR